MEDLLENGIFINVEKYEISPGNFVNIIKANSYNQNYLLYNYIEFIYDGVVLSTETNTNGNNDGFYIIDDNYIDSKFKCRLHFTHTHHNPSSGVPLAEPYYLETEDYNSVYSFFIFNKNVNLSLAPSITLQSDSNTLRFSVEFSELLYGASTPNVVETTLQYNDGSGWNDCIILDEAYYGGFGIKRIDTYNNDPYNYLNYKYRVVTKSAIGIEVFSNELENVVYDDIITPTVTADVVPLSVRSIGYKEEVSKYVNPIGFVKTWNYRLQIYNFLTDYRDLELNYNIINSTSNNLNTFTNNQNTYDLNSENFRPKYYDSEDDEYKLRFKYRVDSTNQLVYTDYFYWKQPKLVLPEITNIFDITSDSFKAEVTYGDFYSDINGILSLSINNGIVTHNENFNNNIFEVTGLQPNTFYNLRLKSTNYLHDEVQDYSDETFYFKTDFEGTPEIVIDSIIGKQYNSLNLGRWFYELTWINSYIDNSLVGDYKIQFKSKNTGYFDLPADTITSSKALVGSDLLRSNEEYEVRVVYYNEIYSKPVKFTTSDIDYPISIIYDDAKFFEQTINWILLDQEHYYDCKVYLQVDGLGLFLINPNSNYLDSNNFKLTGLKPNTEYTWRFRIVHSNAYHNTNKTYISNNYSFTTKKLPKHLCNSNLNKINPDCGDSDGGIYIPIESGYTLNDYLEIFNLSLLVYDLNTNTESVRTDVISSIDGIGFNGLDAGYYHLTITTKPIVWYYYGREGCVKEMIKLENNDSTVGVNSITSKPAICSGFDNQPGRLQVQLDGVSPYYLYWFFNTDGLLIKNGTTTNPYIVLNNATECYYGVIEDSNGCRYLMDEVCIPTETSSSISGIKQLFIAPVTGDIDFDYYNTQDDDYYLDGEDNSFFMSTKISRINTNLTWYKIPIHNGQVSFKQELTKNRQGFIFSDVMEVGIAHQTQEKLNTLLRNLLNKFIVVFQDANGNWWISGYTSHASLDTVVLTTGRRYDSNQYTLNITSNSADNIITNIDEEWVKNNILN